ncbi:MAG: BrnT family toxin [Ectothiorhodospiraceae bacterium]|nr:BrnT family toxin [Ectothiorhodospiraceae bacterium]
MAIDLSQCVGFQWDEGNSRKNWEKHRVTSSECEQLFFNQPLLIKDDISHSKSEPRYFALGRADSDRRLFVVFTVRDNLIRVISARDMSRRERRVYEEVT